MVAALLDAATLKPCPSRAWRPGAAVAAPGRGFKSTGSAAHRRGTAAAAGGRALRVAVHSFAVGRALGLSTPRWMPDFNLEKRKAVLGRFFGPINRQVYEELLDDGFKLREQLREEAGHPRTYGKSDWIELMCSCVAPAIPDFNWSAATDGDADKDGFAIVVVMASGHHTGAPFALPGLPPVEPTGQRVVLEEEIMKVRVEGGRVKEIVVLPSEGAGPLALYKALGGQAGGA